MIIPQTRLAGGILARARRAVPCALLALGTAAALAQSDNFDSGTLDPAWKKSNFNQGLVTESFVNSGSGKAFRLRAVGVPNQAPAAAMYYRDDVYTDFYMAVDLVDWPGTDKNQAFVMVGRGSLSANPATTTGTICNYDTSQYGENPTDRRQGQFQINLVSAGFATKTLAATEITLQPGRSYRIIFMAVGTVYTAKIYDHNDFTKPLVTIVADDAIQGPPQYTSGKCGILGFSRVSASAGGGTVDFTVDNYFAAAADPNTAAAPALPHPLAGTPVVDTRSIPRFKNFLNPADGISFTAKTFTTDVINAAATKFKLNGIDFSSKLTLSANGTSITGSLPGSALISNAVYSAQIELKDATGTKGSTNTFWFDTFSEGYLAAAPVKAIEAEDYNYSGGLHQLEPIPVSGVDTNNAPVDGGGKGYTGLNGANDGNTASDANDIDFFDRTSGAPNEYRVGDKVGITYGMFGELLDLNHQTAANTVDRYSDNVRSQYAAAKMLEYVVNRTEVGEWLNYTRDFGDGGNYRAYLRVASFGATQVELRKVTSDPTQLAQTTSKLGTFNVPNQIARYNYRYIPLTDDSGKPVTLSLSGAQTLRLQMAGTEGQDQRKLAINYILFAPAPAAASGPTIVDTFTDGNDTANPVWDHVDTIGGVTAAPATYSFPNGGYRIFAPIPAAPDAGPARAGSLIKDTVYSDFYVSVDVTDFDDTVRQAFGIIARANTPGLGTTGGYLFSWEPGSGTLPQATGGDLDISKIVGEAPTGQIETAPSGLHLSRTNKYRFVFMGKGFDFEAQVYQLPDTANPLIRLPAHDASGLYPSGQVGLIVADQGSAPLNQGDATFDNFLVTTAEPRINATLSGGTVTLSWPLIPFRLQSATTLPSATWTDVTGTAEVNEQNMYSTSATGNTYYRLVYP